VGHDAALDYVSTADVAGAIAWVVDHEPEHHEYNVCSGEGKTLGELGGLVRALSGSEVEVVTHAADGRAYVGDPGRFMRESGWRPAPLEESVAELFDHYARHRGDIDRSALLRRSWAAE
jgi:nucleoside-diphosphate-sugar epimerase